MNEETIQFQVTLEAVSISIDNIPSAKASKWKKRNISVQFNFAGGYKQYTYEGKPIAHQQDTALQWDLSAGKREEFLYSTDYPRYLGRKQLVIECFRNTRLRLSKQIGHATLDFHTLACGSPNCFLKMTTPATNTIIGSLAVPLPLQVTISFQCRMVQICPTFAYRLSNLHVTNSAGAGASPSSSSCNTFQVTPLIDAEDTEDHKTDKSCVIQMTATTQQHHAWSLTAEEFMLAVFRLVNEQKQVAIVALYDLLVLKSASANASTTTVVDQGIPFQVPLFASSASATDEDKRNDMMLQLKGRAFLRSAPTFLQLDAKRSKTTELGVECDRIVRGFPLARHWNNPSHVRVAFDARSEQVVANHSRRYLSMLGASPSVLVGSNGATRIIGNYAAKQKQLEALWLEKYNQYNEQRCAEWAAFYREWETQLRQKEENERETQAHFRNKTLLVHESQTKQYRQLCLDYLRACVRLKIAHCVEVGVSEVESIDDKRMKL